MALTTPLARITGPVAYRGSTGQALTIPLGPSLLEAHDGVSLDVFWGLHGQRSAVVSRDELDNAERSGHLVRLDSRATAEAWP